jgi:large subunit ribosomal protein L9
MSVELILLEDVHSLGKIGEVVKVADGYARNYLVPRGIAAKATAGSLRQLESKKALIEEQYAAELASATEQKSKMEELSLTIAMQAGEDEKLYGSVSTQQIATGLEEQGFSIDRKKIMLSTPIRELGMFTVDIHLHAEVTVSIKVWVVKA